MKTIAEALRKLEAVDRGEQVDNASLEAHVLRLIDQQESVDQKDAIRTSWINHIVLQRQLDKLEHRSSRLYWIVSGLAIVTVVSSIGHLIATVSQRSAPAEVREAAIARPNTQTDRQSILTVSAKTIEEGLDVYQHEDGTWTWRRVKGDTSHDSAVHFENYSDAVNDALRNGFVGGTITTMRRAPSGKSN